MAYRKHWMGAAMLVGVVTAFLVLALSRIDADVLRPHLRRSADPVALTTDSFDQWKSRHTALGGQPLPTTSPYVSRNHFAEPRAYGWIFRRAFHADMSYDGYWKTVRTVYVSDGLGPWLLPRALWSPWPWFGMFLAFVGGFWRWQARITMVGVLLSAAFAYLIRTYMIWGLRLYLGS